jgi:hypothetical protein
VPSADIGIVSYTEVLDSSRWQEEAAAPAAGKVEKVKRPATAYSRYVKENYGSIAAQHPDKKGVKELGSVIGESWAALSDSEKVGIRCILHIRGPIRLPGQWWVREGPGDGDLCAITVRSHVCCTAMGQHRVVRKREAGACMRRVTQCVHTCTRLALNKFLA